MLLYLKVCLALIDHWCEKETQLACENLECMPTCLVSLYLPSSWPISLLFLLMFTIKDPFATYVYVFLALGYPAPQLLNFGCTLIRYHVEFTRSAIKNVLICGLSLPRIAKKGGVDAGTRITECPLYPIFGPPEKQLPYIL